jgi:hypothetical protein
MPFNPSLKTVANLNRQLKELDLSPAQVWELAQVQFGAYLHANPEQKQELVGQYREHPYLASQLLARVKPRPALLMVLEADPNFSLSEVLNQASPNRETFLAVIQMINQFIL